MFFPVDFKIKKIKFKFKKNLLYEKRMFYQAKKENSNNFN